MTARLLALVGPTASGKTDLAVRAVERSGVDAEIIILDSRQLYRGIDLGTGKPDAEQRRRVEHHLLLAHLLGAGVAGQRVAADRHVGVRPVLVADLGELVEELGAIGPEPDRGAVAWPIHRHHRASRQINANRRRFLFDRGDIEDTDEVELGVLSMILRAGPVVQLVLLPLLLMSVMTWAIIFYKWRMFRQAETENRRFHNLFLHQQRLSTIHEGAEDMTFSPVASIFRAGYIELVRVSRARKKQEADYVPTEPGGLIKEVDGTENINRALRKAAETELTRLERALPFLATTGSTAPFIGLFGTVWGIMNAFRSIGLAGSASLISVAPGISEALVATATGLAAANPGLTVIAAGGDGDGLAIGCGHLIHTIRRNPSLLYIIMNNGTYGLTKGQPSPTAVGRADQEHAVDAIQLGLTIPGSTFMARGYVGQMNQLVDLVEAGLQHVRDKRGFAFLEVISPCVTFNDNYPSWREMLTNLDADEAYDCSDRTSAIIQYARLAAEGQLPSGLIYQGEATTFEEAIGVTAENSPAFQDLSVAGHIDSYTKHMDMYTM